MKFSLSIELFAGRQVRAPFPMINGPHFAECHLNFAQKRHTKKIPYNILFCVGLTSFFFLNFFYITGVDQPVVCLFLGCPKVPFNRRLSLFITIVKLLQIAYTTRLFNLSNRSCKPQYFFYARCKLI